MEKRSKNRSSYDIEISYKIEVTVNNKTIEY